MMNDNRYISHLGRLKVVCVKICWGLHYGTVYFHSVSWCYHCVFENVILKNVFLLDLNF